MTCQLPPKSSRRQLHGSALIIVLAFLVLLCASVVIFLGLTTGSRRSAKLIADNDQARQLARLATDQVVSKLALATTGTTPATVVAPDINLATTWVSQPGMVRLFDADGTLKTAYKLYSAEDLELSGASVDTPQKLLDAIKADTPSDWASKGLAYVDINAPSSDNRYPILPPPSPTAGENPEGFSAPNGVKMPVRWWYLQKDGRLQSTPGDNPVGRIAWWADDETSKLNVNTASEGTSWPGTYATNSYSVADKAPWPFPSTQEYNLIAGHPASTSLSVVFGGWLSSLTPYQVAERLVLASPHVKWEGTRGLNSGAKPYPNSNLNNLNVIGADFQPATREDAPFYSSLDDYFYSNSQPGGDGIRQPLTPLLSRDAIEKARFFVTARSAGANLNPFGRPRISIWPIPSDESQRSNFDKKIVLASRYGGNDYFFVRKGPATQAGTGGGALKETVDVPLGRNTALFTFMENQTKAVIAKGQSPDNFSSKYGSSGKEWQQILTLIFEYIRCTNIMDFSPVGPSYPYVTNSYLSSNLNLSGGLPQKLEKTGMIIPLKKSISATTYRGFGRAPVVSEAALHFFVTKKTMEKKIDPITGEEVDSDKLKEIEVQAALYLEPVMPVVGTPPVYPWVQYNVSPFTFSLTGKGPDAQARSFTIGGNNAVGSINWGGLALWSGGSLGVSPTISNNRSAFNSPENPSPLLPEEPEKYAKITYPLLSGTQTFKASELENEGVLEDLIFTGGNFTFEIRTDNGNIKLQTYILNFESTTIPTPTLPDGVTQRTYKRRLLDYRFSGTPTDLDASDPAPTLFQEGDVVRSIELRDGDLRILACAEAVPKGFFAPHSLYHTATQRLAHSLRHKANAQFGLDAITGKDEPKAGDASGVSYTFLDAPFANRPVEVSWLKDLPPPALGHWLIEENTSGGHRQQYRRDMYDITSRYDLPSTFKEGFEGVNTSWPRDIESGPQTTHRSDEPGMIPDGPWISKAWEANACVSAKIPDTVSQNASKRLFSPYMQVPSPVVLGTLPTGVYRTILAYNSSNYTNARPWQTLLFCPNPLGPITGEHPGKASPKDYRLLDFFQMPVVEPYAITTQGSTYGQVNLNQQIMPFTDITRTTGFRGVLKGVQMHAIPDDKAFTYKEDKNDASILLDIDRDRTVEGWAERFEKGDVYRFPSEICDIYMVPAIKAGFPELPTGASSVEAMMQAWWAGCRMTGKNLREMPYARIYPRLTTQSNTYRVHVIAQTLSPNFAARATDANGGKDQVTGEWRGSMQVERYLDKDKIPSGTNPDNQSLQGYYSFQVGGAEAFR